MMILGVDPGYERSAFVEFDGEHVLTAGIVANEEIFTVLDTYKGRSCDLVLEQIASYGMPVGEEIFETVFWTGRFAERWGRACGRLKRQAIKQHLCHNIRANDGHIRQALIDRFGPGREKAIGRKGSPGPLYCIHRDEWAALAVAVTWMDQHHCAMKEGHG